MAEKVINKIKKKKLATTVTGEPVTKIDLDPEIKNVKEDYQDYLHGVKPLQIDEDFLFKFAEYVYVQLAENSKAYQKLKDKSYQYGIDYNKLKLMFESYLDECLYEDKQQYALEKIDNYIKSNKHSVGKNIIKVLSS